MKKRKVLFLDRDGTLIVDKSYMHKVEDLEIIPEALTALKNLSKLNYAIVLITNQSGIARGKYNEEQFWIFQKAFEKQLKSHGVTLDAVYFCPHHDEKGTIPEYTIVCECRKPKPGMLLNAQKDLNLDLEESWMVGDKDEDVMTGQKLGLNTVRIRSDYGYKEGVQPTHTVNHLMEFYEILSKKKANPKRKASSKKKSA